MLLTIIDHIGVFVFAISGLLTGASKKLDIFGCFVIAFITALGGGTLRDLLLNTEVAWMKKETLIVTIILACITGILFKKRFLKWRKTMFLFDSIGVGVCTILGTQKALDFDHISFVAVNLGVISATFGGVIRDVLCNEIPLVFRKEIYAIACMSGAILFIIISKYQLLNSSTTLIICSATIVILRIFAVRYKWQMPGIKLEE